MNYVVEFSQWLKGTQLSWAVLHYSWIWPACQCLHLIGLTFLLGVVGLFDLRVLGLGKGLSIGLVHRLLPWGIAGFVVNLITGFLFFAGDPFQYVNNPAFQFKVLFLALAGFNVLWFYASGALRRVDALGPMEDAPRQAKLIAGFSLVVWIAVLYCGRMLPFLGNSF